MSWKAAISKPGFNVLTTTNPNNLIFSSDYNTLKYSLSGTITLAYLLNNPSLTYYSVVYTFNFGYRPIIFAYVDIDSTGTYYLMPYRRQLIASILDFHCYWNQNNLNFEIISYAFGGTALAKTATFKFFIFLNNTNL